MFIGWLTCIPAVLLPHSLCRFTTANAPANRQMPIASVVRGKCRKQKRLRIRILKRELVIIPFTTNDFRKKKKLQNTYKMKKSLFLVFLLITVSTMAQESGIRFLQDSTLDAALATANKMQKSLFVDCYTVWCGPCKYVDKNIFPQKEVGDFYNANFACVRLNTELICNKGLKERLNIKAVPSFFFMDRKGIVFHRAVGIPADGYKGFINLGKEALDSTNNMKAICTRIDKGDRTPETLIYYMEKTNKSLDSWKLLEEHYNLMSDEQKLATPTWDLYRHWDKRTNIDLFRFYVGNRKKLEERYGKKEVESMLFDCMQANPGDSLHYGIIGKTDSILYNRFNKYLDYSRAEELFSQVETFDYSKAFEQRIWKNYLEKTKIYFESKDTDTDALNTFSWFIYTKYKNYQDNNALLLAKYWTEITLKEHPDNCMYLDCYAHILYDLKKIKDAIRYEELAVKNGEQSSDYDFYVKELKRYKERK